MLRTRNISISKACAGKFGRNEVTERQFADFESKFKIFYEKFKTSNQNETEEYFKNLFRDFLLNIFYKNKHAINTKSFSGQHGTDLAIHASKDVNSRVEVLIEFKKPSNKTGMISIEKLNRKAMHEAVLYYFQERMKNKNVELKHIIITNLSGFFIFDAKHFYKLFYENATIKNIYDSWSSHKTDDDSTKQMYDIIAQQIDDMDSDIETIHFELKDFTNFSNKSNKSKIRQLYQIFSPRFLLKETAFQDSNDLNKNFYNELLYIMGLEEYRDKNKKLIRRCENKQEGSLLENTISQMKTHQINHPENYGETTEEQQFNYSLQLNITWINRILFLKLLEAQLISYHNKNRDYAFLNFQKIKSYKDLSELFFQVLAIKQNERSNTINYKFENLPYLNSSLFDRTDQEEIIGISELNDQEIPVYKKTVLKNGNKRFSGKMKTLEYLLRFLDAYNFGSEIDPDEERKSLINASVLGLIFEKINGYKEGSYYTPGYITMYMSRETLRRSVLDKLNTAFDKNFQDYNELVNFCANLYNSTDLKKANNYLDSITICDPAVGSGHFLVSALNEMIAIKSELGILCDINGKPRKDWEILVANDELNIHDAFGESFEYKLNENGIPHKELQNIQKTIFHQKQSIIENCLFGVDINPNSVNICRLRLWIELLKNAYYTEESKFVELQTLPNIDINIKCGNSLISRFDLKENLSTILKRTNMTVGEYLQKVRDYKNATGKQEKQSLQNAIDQIKKNFKKEMMHQTEVFRKFARLERKYHSFFEDQDLFEENRKIKQKSKEFDKTEKDYNKAKAEWEVWESGEVYRKAFEWRFEFPEVLDETGKFTGFDIVIGNPPYIVIKGSRYSSFEYTTSEIEYVKKYYLTGEQQINTYTIFIEKSHQLSKHKGFVSLIIPNTLLANEYSKKIRDYILNNCTIYEIDNLSKVFEDANVEVIVIFLASEKDYSIKTQVSYDLQNYWFSDLRELSKLNIWKKYLISVKEYEQKLIFKIHNNGNPLSHYSEVWRGLTTGNDKKYLVKHKLNELYKPVISGSDVNRYLLNFTDNYVCYDKSKLDRARNESIFNSKFKLISKFVSKDLVFCYDDNQYYVLNTACLLIMKSEDIKIKYMLGLLNSKLINYYFTKAFTDYRSTYPIKKSSNIESIPIVIADNNIVNVILQIVNHIISFKKKLLDTQSLEDEIDLIVYKLYELSYAEVLIVDPQFQLSKEEYERFEVKQPSQSCPTPNI